MEKAKGRMMPVVIDDLRVLTGSRFKSQLAFLQSMKCAILGHERRKTRFRTTHAMGTALPF